MSKSDWKTIYRAYSGEELAAEITQLRKAAKGGFAAQSSGGVSHQRDLGEIRDRLAAATEVQRERSGNLPSTIAVVDHSGLRTGDF